MGISLAPYDDSMRLGQGYNSFLQTPCMYDAVKISERISSTSAGSNKSQTVSYSSHIINRISEVARSMGISTGSTIKNGSIALAGNASSIDESKFAESHLNIVVSVKVVNLTIENSDEDTFRAQEAKFIGDKANTAQKESDESKKTKALRQVNREFHETYGDSYISGFIEGGDLHGVVSIKVLDSTKKEEVKAQITRDINSSDPSDMRVDPSFLATALETRLQGCETTIAVNWSGGGRIKPDDEEWSLDSLFRVAAEFPALVATCPRRTWAVLTPYNNNAEFLKWSLPLGIEPYEFHGVSAYAADLLDTYMAHKNNVRQIQAVLDSPRSYMRSPGKHPIDISVGALVGERKKIKSEMSKIMNKVDELNNNPGDFFEQNTAELMGVTNNEHNPESPEEWATRLPIPRTLSPHARDALGRFALLDTESYTPPSASPPSALGKPNDDPAEKLFNEAARSSFTDGELEALQWELNRRIMKNFVFEAWPSPAPKVAQGTPIPSDRLRDELRMNAVFADQFGWPNKIDLSVNYKDNIPQLKFKFLFTKSDIPSDFTRPNLLDNERIKKVRIGKISREQKDIISYVQVTTTNGSQHTAGSAPDGHSYKDFNLPSGCSGLLGFVATACHEDIGAVERLLLAWK